MEKTLKNSTSSLKQAIAITLDACRGTVNRFILQMNKTEGTFLNNGFDEKLAVITTTIDTTSSELRKDGEPGTMEDVYQGIGVLLQTTMDIEKMCRTNIEETGIDVCEELDREFGDKPEVLETLRDSTMLNFYTEMKYMRKLHEKLGALMVIASDPETGLNDQQKNVFDVAFEYASDLREFTEEKYNEFKLLLDESDRSEDGYIKKLAGYRFVIAEIHGACAEYEEMVLTAFNTIPNDNPKKGFLCDVSECLNDSQAIIPTRIIDYDYDIVPLALQTFMTTACGELLRIMKGIHVIAGGADNDSDGNPGKTDFINKCNILEDNLREIKARYLDEQIDTPDLGSPELKADIDVLRRSASICLNLELATSNVFKKSGINPYEEKTENIDAPDFVENIFFNFGKEICYEAYRFSLLVIACLGSDADVNLMKAAIILWERIYLFMSSFGAKDTERTKLQDEGHEFTCDENFQYSETIDDFRSRIDAMQCGYSALLSLLPSETVRRVMESQHRLYQPRYQLSEANYGRCVIPLGGCKKQ